MNLLAASTRPCWAQTCAFFLALSSLLVGCRGSRTLRIESVPSGATVRLDDQVIGRTPLEIDFEHYGQRRLALYKTTYRTYSEPLILRAPWWARFPVDLVTEVLLPLGLDDVREARIVLAPDAGEPEANDATQNFLENALRARGGDRLDEAADRDTPTPLLAEPTEASSAIPDSK